MLNFSDNNKGVQHNHIHVDKLYNTNYELYFKIIYPFRYSQFFFNLRTQWNFNEYHIFLIQNNKKAHHSINKVQ